MQLGLLGQSVCAAATRVVVHCRSVVALCSSRGLRLSVSVGPPALLQGYSTTPCCTDTITRHHDDAHQSDEYWTLLARP